MKGRLHFFAFGSLILASLILFFGLYLSLPSLSAPYGDTWDTPVQWLMHNLQVQGLLNAQSGESVWQNLHSFISSLMQQHNESRKVTYKFLALALDPYVPSYGVFWHWFSFFVRVLTVALIIMPVAKAAGIEKTAFSTSKWRTIAVYLVFGFGLFVYATGPANLINGLWEVQLSFFLGLFFAMLSLNLFAKLVNRVVNNTKSLTSELQSTANSDFFLAVSAGLASFLSIFSFAGNVVIAVVNALLIICALFACLRRGVSFGILLASNSFRMMLLSFALSLVAVGIFFYGWFVPLAHEGLRGGLSLEYVSKFLGGFYKHFMTWFGPSLYPLFLLPILIVALLALNIVWNRRACSRAYLTLAAQIIFVLGLACASSTGRSGGGSNVALSDRYNTCSILYIFLTINLSCWLLMTQKVISKVYRFLLLLTISIVSLIGVLENIYWYKAIASQRATQLRAEKCFKEYYKTDPSEDFDFGMEKCSGHNVYYGSFVHLKRSLYDFCFLSADFKSKSSTYKNLCNWLES